MKEELRELETNRPEQVTIKAKCRRNKTGLQMVFGQEYKARYISRRGWKDGSYCAQPTGVEFRGALRVLAGLVRWLRPFRDGKWFELVGRINGGCVFRVLNDQDATCWHRFKASSDGELFLMVNDIFYFNNKGEMTIEIKRL